MRFFKRFFNLSFLILLLAGQMAWAVEGSADGPDLPLFPQCGEDTEVLGPPQQNDSLPTLGSCRISTVPTLEKGQTEFSALRETPPGSVPKSENVDEVH